MKITICSSLDFTNAIKEIADSLISMGHEVIIPMTAEMILNNQVGFGQIIREKENGEIAKRIIEQDTIRYYYKKIQESDAILVLNYEKKGVSGYIGGSVFLEMGFAHALGKKIFLLNPIPEMHYRDEIKAMQPLILNGDLSIFDKP
jgi:nucleoside 2-deoxyribosyltransferase